MSAYRKPLALAKCIELGALVPPGRIPPRVRLVAGLAYMVLAGAVAFALKNNPGLVLLTAEKKKFLVRKRIPGHEHSLVKCLSQKFLLLLPQVGVLIEAVKDLDHLAFD